MAVYSLYIISKSGSLLYQKDFNVVNSPISKHNTNDYLVIASTLHGVHAIASKLTPKEAMGNYERSRLPSNSNRYGLQCIRTDRFNICVYQSTTGLKIILITSKDLSDLSVLQLQSKLYEYYTDFVLKNPFYRLEMPIRLKLFDDKVQSVVTSHNV
ncbi:DEKNAAC104210 [Brettanomyces naardenensis]|uniref:Trafficking protein particle complex subunit n=1 Tax=Brettanomyces naardenensis TaxID=13370 RepID=A0A448YQ27_BRENA|nr:DEKNAAC104210 [Brettanomyces naardenensis]